LCNDILPSAGTLGLLVYTTTTKIYKHLLIILIDIPFMIFLLIKKFMKINNIVISSMLKIRKKHGVTISKASSFPVMSPSDDNDNTGQGDTLFDQGRAGVNNTM
jgi:hypothetical protein